ncbi:MAG: class I SAM-dependent methyltransferase [Solirubrobacterales bacterium]|nr:class I SAM-dependent methyltransferase [Solirubrobacterales bacterium]
MEAGSTERFFGHRDSHQSDAAARVTPGEDRWDSHWDDFGKANERNPAQEYRRQLALWLLQRRGTPERLLDIGCGNGEFLAAAAARWPSAELLGLELSEAAVDAAHRKVPTARLRACDLLAEAAATEGENGWATHAVCSEVLEHVDDPVGLLRSARQWLAPGCRLVVTVPGGPMSGFDRHIGHRQHFSPDDLRDVMSAAGLEVVRVEGAGFPFFNLYRGLVIFRGDRLIADARPDAEWSPAGLLVRAAMAAFRPLFLLNLPRSPFGWQTLGIAREPLIQVSADDLRKVDGGTE